MLTMQAQTHLRNETSEHEEIQILHTSDLGSNELNIDDLLETEVGPTGLWQWSICLLILFSTSSLTTFAVFANSSPRHRCRMESQVEEFIQTNNISFDEAASIIGPWTTVLHHDNQTVQSSSRTGCHRYQLKWEDNNLVDIFINKNLTKLRNAQSELCPHGYVFDSNPFNYPGNVVSEFETVCNYSWLVPFGTSIYMFGMMLGFILGGWFGDRLGRKKTIILFSLIELLTGIWTTLSPNYTSYIIARAFMAVGSTGKVNACSVLVIELTLARYRSLFTASLGVGLNFFFRALMALYAYLIPQWRLLNLAAMSPNLLSIFYFYYIPESPRWFLAKKQTVQALLVMQSAYRINHYFKQPKQSERLNRLINYYTIQEQITKETQSNSHVKESFNLKIFLKSASIFKPFSNRQLATTTILGSSFVFGIVMCFFGLTLYARIVWNYVYLIAFLNSLTAIPAVSLAVLLYRYIRRRRPPLMFVLILSSIILGTCSIYTVIAKPQNDIVLTIFSNMGMILVNSSLTMCYVYIPELFPSEIRTFGFGTILGLARFGSMACTFINELDRLVAHGFPLIIYSVVLLLECFVLCGLKDTSGQNLTDLIDQKAKDHTEKL